MMRPRASEVFTELVHEFERKRTPIPIRFRDIVSVAAGPQRATHLIHPYPAKLIPHIPRFFLESSIADSARTILDPFCGSGTVLLETVLSGRNAIGADANPLARLISAAKLRPMSGPRIRKSVARLLDRIPRRSAGDLTGVLNVDHWFHPHVQRGLLRVRDAVFETRDVALRELYMVALSATIRDVSLADPRLSVPVRLRANQYERGHWLYEKTQDRIRQLQCVDVREAFARRLDRVVRQVEELAEARPSGRLLRIESCARALHNTDNASVDMVISSPPYLGAQKYVRASSLSLTWLRLCSDSELASIERLSVGREHFRSDECAQVQCTGHRRADALIRAVRKQNPLRARIASQYMLEMREALEEVKRVLVPRGHAVLVLGASKICGRVFDTPQFLVDIAQSIGFELRLHLVDPIRSRALMTKRNRTAGVIDTEAVLLLQKAVQ